MAQLRHSGSQVSMGLFASKSPQMPMTAPPDTLRQRFYTTKTLRVYHKIKFTL